MDLIQTLIKWDFTIRFESKSLSYSKDKFSPIKMYTIICVRTTARIISLHACSSSTDLLWIAIMEGWSASHLISSSEPHSAQFLVQATSKCSSFNFPCYKCAYFCPLKYLSKIQHKIWKDLHMYSRRQKFTWRFKKHPSLNFKYLPSTTT